METQDRILFVRGEEGVYEAHWTESVREELGSFLNWLDGVIARLAEEATSPEPEQTPRRKQGRPAALDTRSLRRSKNPVPFALSPKITTIEHMSYRVIEASEIVEYIYCRRGWWLQRIVGRESRNVRQLADGESTIGAIDQT